LGRGAKRAAETNALIDRQRFREPEQLFVIVRPDRDRDRRVDGKRTARVLTLTNDKNRRAADDLQTPTIFGDDVWDREHARI
jgi:hypothetical protein